MTKIDQLIKINGADRAFAIVNEMENEYYLKDIRQSIFLGNDNRYHFFIKLPSGKRKHMVAKEKENLENKIVDFYKNNQAIRQSLSVCINDIVYDFLKFKRQDASPATAYRAENIYKRHLADSQLATMDLNEITTIILKEYCLDQIERYKLTSKAYRELKTFLNCIFDYAVETRLIQVNVARQMSRINYKKFSKTKTTPDMQVYSVEEEERLYRVAIEMFQKTGNVCYLAIILSGCLGLRVGELVALRESDFDLKSKTICIQRQEVRCWETDEENNLRHSGFEVVDYLKTEESVRNLPITDTVENIYRFIVNHNKSRDLDSGYLFVRDDGSRINGTALSKALRRANKNAGLPQRSNHKLRKTLLSELEHSIGATKTKAFAGHSHNSVTLERNYLYITSPLTSEAESIEDILTRRMPTQLMSEQK